MPTSTGWAARAISPSLGSTTMPAPFFVSSRGYGVALRSSAIASLAFPGANLSDLCY